MITSSLLSDLRLLSRDVTLFLRGTAGRSVASDIMSAFGICIVSASEVSPENSPELNSRLINSALRGLRRADSLIEIATDGGTIPEAQGNRWLRRCRTLMPRLKNAYKDSRRLAGLSFRLPKVSELFSTARLTVRTVGEGDLTFIVTLLGDPECFVYGVAQPRCCDSARELVKGETVSVITRGDGERVGIIFCEPDVNVEGRCWLKPIIAVGHRGRGYSLEVLVGFGCYALENRIASDLSVYVPHSKRNYADALLRYGYTLDRIGDGLVANKNIDRTPCL